MTGRAGGMRSVVFTPPPEPGPQRVSLYQDASEAVIWLGEMLTATKTIDQKLKSLPFAGSGHRGELRVILGQARRIQELSVRLLGEEGAAQ